MRILTNFLLLLALIAAPATAQLAPEKTTDASYTRSILKRLAEGVVKIELSNGLRVLIFPRKQAPVFSGHIWVRVGSVDETPGVTGVSHMLEHMAFKGSKTIGTTSYPKEKDLLHRVETLMDGEQTPAKLEELKEVYKELESIWVNNEFSRIYQKRGAVGLNAATGKDYTFYLVSLPNVAFELWCWMESDRLLNPVFRQFYKERAVVGEERRSRVEDDPDGKLYEALLATAFRAHPNRLPTIGWPSDIAQLRTADIEKFYKTYYRPDNMVVALVGDLDPEKIKPVLEKYFGRLPRAEDPLPTVRVVEPPQKGERRAVVEFDAEPEFLMAFHKPVWPHKDDLQFTVLHSLLSDGRSSLLYRELVQKQRLATSVYTSEAPGELFPSLFYVSAAPIRGVSNDKLIDGVQSILDRLKTEVVSQQDLESAKKRVKVSLLNLISSNYGLARVLGRVELLWGDWQKMFEMYDVTFATEPDDIRRLAQTYFNRSNRTLVRLERAEAKSNSLPVGDTQ